MSNKFVEEFNYELFKFYFSMVRQDTSYGYGLGQTTWQDSVRDWYEKNYEISKINLVILIYVLWQI